MRRLRYWIGYVVRFNVRLVTECLLKVLLDRWGRWASFEGIRIVAPPGRKGDDEPPFLRHTVETLRLIQSVDPRRFRRLQREIAVVEDTPSPALGIYSRPGRRCGIDFARYDADRWEQYPEWYQWLYATTLVHEATHGAICSRYVHYTTAWRVRIERLCCTEARRFATRANRDGQPWSNDLVPPFDERRWHENWHSTWWQRAKRHFARFREVHAQEQERRR